MSDHNQNQIKTIDKKQIATMLGYSTTRSVCTLIARRPDFPAPITEPGDAVGRGRRALWKYSEVAEWFKRWRKWEHINKEEKAL